MDTRRKVNKRYSIITKNGREYIFDHYKVFNYYSCDIYRVNDNGVTVWDNSFNRDTKQAMFNSIDMMENYLIRQY